MNRPFAVVTPRRVAPALLGVAAIWLGSLGGTAQAASKPICINLSPLVKAQIVLFGPLSSCDSRATARSTRH
jgi:hypothetical protein